MGCVEDVPSSTLIVQDSVTTCFRRATDGVSSADAARGADDAASDEDDVNPEAGHDVYICMYVCMYYYYIWYVCMYPTCGSTRPDANSSL